MCSDEHIACTRDLTAVDTSKQCTDGTCTVDECCTYEAWGKKYSDDVISRLVNGLKNCDNTSAALRAAKDTFSNLQISQSLFECGFYLPPYSSSDAKYLKQCLDDKNNLQAIEQAAKQACNNPK
jgi:hypothetical protein